MGMIASIYDSKHGRDPLSLIPADIHEVTIVNVDGPFEPNDERPPVKLIFRDILGRKIVHAAPVDENGEEFSIGAVMKGYSFIDSGDSRVSRAIEAGLGHAFYGAIALHDRCERW